MEGQEVMGADLRPVDFYGERRGEVSRRVRGRQRGERTLEFPLELANLGNVWPWMGRPNLQAVTPL